MRITTRILRVRMVVALLLTPFSALADEKRVTVPIALPFQNQSSVAAVSANPGNAASESTQVSSAPAQTVTAMPFTQTVEASSVATSSVTNLPAEMPVISNSAPLAEPPSPVAPKVASPSAPAKANVNANNKVAASAKAAPGKTDPAKSTNAKNAAPKPATAKPATPATPSKADNAGRLADDPPEEPAQLIPTITTEPISAPRVPAGHPEAFVAEFEDYVAKKVAPFVPGVAIVVVSGGQVKSLQGYGVRRAGTREKITPDTVFRLASLSKAFAATAASELVNEGKISWDTTISSVLPDVTFKNARYGKQLTLRDVLSQASGLPRHTYTHFIDANMPYSETVRRLRYVNFVCPPGKCYAYQNVSYSLAGDMIRKRSGMSFEKYVDQQVFDPLGMRSASYGLNNYNASPNRASPHINQNNRWISTSVSPNWYRVAPAAGVNASIADMSQFLLGQIGKKPEALPLAVLSPIQSRVTKNTPAQNYYGVRKAVTNTAYGMGWRVFDYGRYKNFVHHGGHVKGFRTEMVFNRDLQIGMVFLTNSESRLAKDIIFKFLEMYEHSRNPSKAKKPSAQTAKAVPAKKAVAPAQTPSQKPAPAAKK